MGGQSPAALPAGQCWGPLGEHTTQRSQPKLVQKELPHVVVSHPPSPLCSISPTLISSTAIPGAAVCGRKLGTSGYLFPRHWPKAQRDCHIRMGGVHQAEAWWRQGIVWCDARMRDKRYTRVSNAHDSRSQERFASVHCCGHASTRVL